MIELRFHKAPDREKQLAFIQVADRLKLPPHAIEKDWWVTLSLRIIFGLPAGSHLLFKGGTSLSKAWGLIERFSEDIDLVLNRGFLGFAPGIISKTQVRKLRSASNKYLTGDFLTELEEAFAGVGFEGLAFAIENPGDGDQDPVAILIHYPAVTEHSDYLPPQIKVEIGSRSMVEPFTKRPVRSLMAETFPDRSFADEPLDVPCVNPERTLLEKLFLLHEEFQKPPGKIRVNRLSRHLYDIWKIGRSEYKHKAFSEDLIANIIAHRERFTGIKGVDYQKLFPPHLAPLPPDALLPDWEKDYKTMQHSMIHGDSLAFDVLLEDIARLTTEYNNLIL